MKALGGPRNPESHSRLHSFTVLTAAAEANRFPATYSMPIFDVIASLVSDAPARIIFGSTRSHSLTMLERSNTERVVSGQLHRDAFGKRNGELRAVAAAASDMFITADGNRPGGTEPHIEDARPFAAGSLTPSATRSTARDARERLRM